MQLHICGLDTIHKFRDIGLTHILSLIDADPVTPTYLVWDSLPDEPTNIEHLFEAFHPHERLELRFDDVTEETNYYVAPTMEDVQRILDFGKTLAKTDKLLVHCHAGISRSTAAAALILLQETPEIPATEIFERILRIRPVAYPNSRILEYGGYILDRQDEIMKAVEQKCYDPTESRREKLFHSSNWGR